MIDTNKLFEQYVKRWIQDNADRLASENLDMDMLYPEIYASFNDTIFSELGNKTPRQYFSEIENPTILFEMAKPYFEQRKELPQLLEMRLRTLGKEEEDAFIVRLLTGNLEERLFAAQMLAAMRSEKAFESFAELIQNAKESDELVEMALEGVVAMGKKKRKQLLEAYDNAKGYAKDCFLEALSHIGGKGVRERLLQELRLRENIPFVAQCLARLDDKEVILELKEMLLDDTLTYFEYTAIKEAIENLDNSVLDDKEFVNDADYIYLSNFEPQIGLPDEDEEEPHEH